LLRLRESVAIAKDELGKATIDADVPCPSDYLHYAMQAKNTDELIGVRIKQLQSALSALIHDIDVVVPEPVVLTASPDEQWQDGYDITQCEADGTELMTEFWESLPRSIAIAKEHVAEGYCHHVNIEHVHKKLVAVVRIAE
jgi:hypothetical protein